MDFKDAQQDMSFAYVGGGTGALVSGIVWCIAGTVALFYSNQTSMLTLFFGGMFIHPLAMLLSKICKRPGVHHKENPLAALAFESTMILFVGMFLAFYVASLQVDMFYPIMLMIIGVRYLAFNTLYGTKIYWLLGGCLIIAGVLCTFLAKSFYIGAFVGGAIEIVFSVVLFNQSKALVLKNAQS